MFDRPDGTFVDVIRRALCMLATAALVQCSSAPTEVQVLIDTNAPSDQLMTIAATVHYHSSGAVATHTWHRGAGAQNGITLPGSFAITPGRGGRIDDTVDLTLDSTLTQPGASPLSWSRRLTISFVPNTTVRVRVYLSVACSSMAMGCTSVPATACTQSILCGDLGETCGDNGMCTQVMVTTPDAGVTSDGQADGTGADGGTCGDAMPACSPGATRACGNCGSQTCQSNCQWGACMGEGACSPGATTSCRNCGTRTCQSNCQWGSCGGQGPCSAGATQACMCNGTQTCGTDCQWGSCMTGCAAGDVCTGGSCCTPSCTGITCGYQTCNTGVVCNHCPTATVYLAATCMAVSMAMEMCNPSTGACVCPGSLTSCCGGCCP